MTAAIKSGAGAARILGLRPEMSIAFTICAEVFRDNGSDCVITAGIDGSHSRGSIHYKGLAVDLRAHHIPDEDRAPILDALRKNLGDDFDVLLENDTTPNVHYHVEFDPKTPINK